MWKLSAYMLRITIEALEPIRLGTYPGSALRGALMGALLHRFCGNPGATTCQGCPLHAGCPVTGLVAPLREDHPRGQDGPRPFVLGVAYPVSLEQRASDAIPDEGGDHVLQPGNCLAFDLTLLGTATQYFRLVMLSLPIVEDVGIGTSLQRLGGRRGRLRVLRVEAVDLEGVAKEPLYTADHRVATEPCIKITPTDIAEHAEQLATGRLTLDFVTPTRLIGGGHLLKRPEFHPLVLRLVERLEALEGAYGEVDDLDPDEARQVNYQRYVSFGRLASQVRLGTQHVSWVDLSSYSSRQKRSTPIGGFIGQVTYEGDLRDLRELLVWGEVVHVGKNAVKGDGCYRIASG